MKRLLFNISALFLTCLVVVASMGFTINKHFCGGELQQVTINKGVDSCPMCKKVAELPPCHKKALEKENNGCCENEQDKVETSEFSISKKVEKESFTDFQFIAFTYVLIADIHSSKSDLKTFNNTYSPPLIEHDIPVETQSFLL